MPDPVPQTWEAAAAVLDAAPICHLAFVEAGLPRVLPVAHALVGTTLYLHGSPASTALRAAASGEQVSLSAVVLEGEWLPVFQVDRPIPAFRVEGASFCGKDMIVEMENAVYRGDMYRFAAKAVR